MPKRTSHAKRRGPAARLVVVTLDSHLSSAARRAAESLADRWPGFELALHAATDFARDAGALESCLRDIERADFIVTTMLFMDEHIDPVYEALAARRDHCDAMVCMLSAERVTRLTRLGRFRLDGFAGSLFGLLRHLRPRRTATHGTRGASQLAALARIPRLLGRLPGPARDLRNYLLLLQYWLAGSEANLANLCQLLVGHYAVGPRKGLAGGDEPAPPLEYPRTGLYHPRLPGRIGVEVRALPRRRRAGGRVGVLVMRSYVLAGNTAHYDAVIAALEARGLDVVAAFSSGLDARDAIETYFRDNGVTCIDALVSLTGFSLVGGPAWNDSEAAQAVLGALDVPLIAAHAVEFQTLAGWRESELGLTPVETTLMQAIPELDGATGSMVIGGRGGASGQAEDDMCGDHERAEMLASRVAAIVALRRRPRAERRVAIVLFNFPPNGGSVGSAAYLAVFESLLETLRALQAAGYCVDVPESVDVLRSSLIEGNAQRHGTDANVCAEIPVESHVENETDLEAIEAQWGPAPGRQLSNGRSIFVLGRRFGNVFVGLQPSFGYEGDPMRLLFERGFAPTHAFSAFYRYLRQEFAADAVVHFGTHGALEFMPGKQAGLSRDCWPDRLIGHLPNIYLYAANNPSEATIAKRRSAATIVSYLTPSITQAGLYSSLSDLRSLRDRLRAVPPHEHREREQLEAMLLEQATESSLLAPETLAALSGEALIARIGDALTEIERTLIPDGLHVLGRSMMPSARREILAALATSLGGTEIPDAAIDALIEGVSAATLAKRHRLQTQSAACLETLEKTNAMLADNCELDALVHALDGGFVAPAPGGDLIRTPEVLPSGRNIHGFDPFRLPSRYALAAGARDAAALLERSIADGHGYPESVAVVLWGTDNLKSEGASIALALALMGVQPRFDEYGRLTGTELIPLSELGRPRIDVVMTVSGIFRDLLPLQTRLLADAAWLAATAEEDPEQNFVRRHALAEQQAGDCDIETAALRVFGNATGAYGANVNHLVDNGNWNEESELAETFGARKSFAYSRSGDVTEQRQHLTTLLGDVTLAYQNVESAELGVTALDQYFDTLGGLSRMASTQNGGTTLPVYIGDQTRSETKLRSLAEQIALESHTRLLNDKWYEPLLRHGYEGVRQIQEHVRNTVGWSATTEQVQPWVYERVSETYMLDEQMRRRLAELNPAASVQMATRLLEAHERNYWTADEQTLAALREAQDELEDRLEGIKVEVAA